MVTEGLQYGLIFVFDGRFLDVFYMVVDSLLLDHVSLHRV